MNRFKEGTIVIGKRIKLTEDEILRLKIEMIELGRLLDIDRFGYDPIGNLDVNNESMLDLMDQQSQAQSNTQPTSSNSNIPAPIYSSTQRSASRWPSRASYNEYGNERDDIKPNGKRFSLKTIDKKLLLDDGRFLNLMAHDPPRWLIALEMWSQMVTRKYDELEIEKTPVEMYSYSEKFLGETARTAWEA